MALQMGMSVSRFLASHTSSELTELEAMDLVEPIGSAGDDQRSAMLASVIVNAAGGKKRSGEPFTAADFMPKFEPPQTEPAPDLAGKLNAILGRMK